MKIRFFGVVTFLVFIASFSFADEPPAVILDRGDLIGGDVRFLAFSSDNTVLVSASKSCIRLWNMEHKECIKTLLLPGNTIFGGVLSVAFSPDGEFLAVGNDQSDIQLWDVDTMECEAVLEGHRGWVISIAFSPDSNFLVSGSNDSTVKLWNMQDKKCIHTFEGDKFAVESVVFSPDGKFFASASWNSTVQLWDMETKECLTTFRGSAPLAFSPDGTMLASHQQVWSMLQKKVIAIFIDTGWGSHAFSSDSKFLACGGESWGFDRVNFLAVDNFSLKEVIFSRILPAKTTGLIKAITFSSDGKFLAAGGENGIILWDIASWNPEKITEAVQKTQAITANNKLITVWGAVKKLD